MERSSSPMRRASAVLAAVASVGFSADDDEGRRMEKSVLTFTAVFTVVVVTPWTAFYYAIGIPLAAAIPTVYILASVAGLVHLRATRDDRWFRRSQTTMYLLLPPLVHVALGGFAAAHVLVQVSPWLSGYNAGSVSQRMPLITSLAGKTLTCPPCST